MRESCTYGVVRGALSNERPYRDHHCPGRGTSTPDSEILRSLLQWRQNTSVSKQRYAGFSAGSAIRSHQFARHLGRTSPSLRAGLIFRYKAAGANRSVTKAFVIVEV